MSWKVEDVICYWVVEQGCKYQQAAEGIKTEKETKKNFHQRKLTKDRSGIVNYLDSQVKVGRRTRPRDAGTGLPHTTKLALAASLPNLYAYVPR